MPGPLFLCPVPFFLQLKRYRTEWVSYCKPPFKKTLDVIDYLGGYTHRIEISNRRLLKLENDKVTDTSSALL